MTTTARAWTRMAAAASFYVASIGMAPAAGALAVGSCGAYGFAYDYKQAAAAAQAALAKCAGGCTVVPVNAPAGRSRSMGAMPARPTATLSPAGSGQAQNSALRQCYEYGGKDCVIRAWACDAKG